MHFKKSPPQIQDKTSTDYDEPNDYPTLADLMSEQIISSNKVNTVHHRRDLDSLG
tara:strand:+ start:332 stop:496 length:165 start_codon:yes stop_codon:yes gene_type:complete